MNTIPNNFAAFVCFTLVLCAATIFVSKSTVAQNDDSKTVIKEIGLVNWGRDFDAAQKAAQDSGKPVLLMFQEIPGCQGCQDYGDQVLSHPLIVEAAEDLFVPSLVYNNREGVDAEMLKRFEEPSWNYPVARYLDASGKDLIPRKDKIWEVPATAQRMVEALEKADRDVPEYLRLLAAENAELEQATFAMHCYWEGEAALGSLDGVLSTRSAWLDGKEVVRVEFDPSVTDYSSLVKEAKKMKCASNVYAHSEEQLKTSRSEVGELAKLAAKMSEGRDAKESDQKYYLLNSIYRFLPLTEAQAVKVNSVLVGENPDVAECKKWLSPRQQVILERIQTLSPVQKSELATLSRPNSNDELIAYQGQLVQQLDAWENQ